MFFVGFVAGVVALGGGLYLYGKYQLKKNGQTAKEFVEEMEKKEVENNG